MLHARCEGPATTGVAAAGKPHFAFGTRIRRCALRGTLRPLRYAQTGSSKRRDIGLHDVIRLTSRLRRESRKREQSRNGNAADQQVRDDVFCNYLILLIYL
jgi:hypothetical protein